MERKPTKFTGKKIFELIKKDDVKLIELQFTDLFGNIKSTTIPIERLSESLERGTWFDGSSVEGFARIHESDMFLMPDSTTYTVLPWRPKQKAEARIICDVYSPDRKPYESDPRFILKRALEEAKKLGFIYNVGPEVEFFLFKIDNEPEVKPVLHDYGSYFDFAPRDLASDVRRDTIFSLESLGFEVEMSHHEVAPGQHEIDFKYSDALKAADNTITLKHTIKAIAHSHGLHASFMPKPVFGINGSGMHTHQSLYDIKRKTNAFFDSNDKHKLSKIAKQFIAGQLKYIREISAILAPTVNSYKRLVPGYEAPVYISWASINRSALIRIPKYSKGREQSTRAELRCPDPSCNPYLAFAVMLKAGLQGIKENLELCEPIEEDVYEFNDEKLKELKIRTLPGSLKEAIEEMKKSKLVKETLGEKTFEKYIKAKEREWDEYRIQITDWEKQKYFELL